MFCEEIILVYKQLKFYYEKFSISDTRSVHSAGKFDRSLHFFITQNLTFIHTNTHTHTQTQHLDFKYKIPAIKYGKFGHVQKIIVAIIVSYSVLLDIFI